MNVGPRRGTRGEAGVSAEEAVSGVTGRPRRWDVARSIVASGDKALDAGLGARDRGVASRTLPARRARQPKHGHRVGRDPHFPEGPGSRGDRDFALDWASTFTLVNVSLQSDRGPEAG